MSTNKSSSEPKRKQLALSTFFQSAPKKNLDGTLTQRILPKVAAKAHHDDAPIPCKSKRCTKPFKNFQGLGSHLNS